MKASWSAFGDSWSRKKDPWKALGGSQERSGRYWRPIWQNKRRKNAEKMQARRNAQACSRWFTIVLGGYRRLAAGSTPRLYLTRSAPLSGAADLIQDAYGEAPPPTPLRPAPARRGMRSWRLLGLRSKREGLGGLSWNILENSWHNKFIQGANAHLPPAPDQRPVGEVLEACRRSIGGFWGSFSRCLELPGGVLEHLGASWRPLGAAWGALEQLWGALERLLAVS